MRLREEIEKERSTEEGFKEEKKCVNRERNSGDDIMDWADKCRSLVQLLYLSHFKRLSSLFSNHCSKISFNGYMAVSVSVAFTRHCIDIFIPFLSTFAGCIPDNIFFYCHIRCI